MEVALPPRDGEPAQATVCLVDQDNGRTAQLTDPRPDAAFASGTACSLLPVGSLRASRGTIRPVRPADSGASSRLRTFPFRSATKQAGGAATRSPAALQILRPCGEPETATNHMASLPRMQVTLSPSRPVSGVLSSAPAWHSGPADRNACAGCRLCIPDRDITDIVRRSRGSLTLFRTAEALRCAAPLSLE